MRFLARLTAANSVISQCRRRDESRGGAGGGGRRGADWAGWRGPGRTGAGSEAPINSGANTQVEPRPARPHQTGSRYYTVLHQPAPVTTVTLVCSRHNYSGTTVRHPATHPVAPSPDLASTRQRCSSSNQRHRPPVYQISVSRHYRANRSSSE